MEELDLRIKAILRRSDTIDEEKEVFELGRYKFDYVKQELSLDGDCRKLTSKEAELLLLLAQSINKTLDRSVALKIIWGDDSYFNARSMDVYITKLRKHLKEDDTVNIITIHGHGFRLAIDR
jgi:DNA-binding response OmpR family regulator